MPESKNNFLKGRMNKDLDERLVDSQEYRDARNVTVSGSDTGNSGSIENVRGNIKVTDFGLTDRRLSIIGSFVDIRNNRYIAFITNYNDSSPDQLSNFAPSTSSHYIASYDINTQTARVLVKGSFLNFSKTHRIDNINIIEDIIIWTDNRNQPRKINIDRAISSSDVIDTNPYYAKEDDISLARYYPYSVPRVYKQNENKGLNLFRASLMQDVTQFPDNPQDGNYTFGTFSGGGITVTSSNGSQKFLQLNVTVGGGNVINIQPKMTPQVINSNFRYIVGGTQLEVGDTLTIDSSLFGVGNNDDLIIELSEESLAQTCTMVDSVSQDLPVPIEFSIFAIGSGTGSSVIASSSKYDSSVAADLAYVQKYVGTLVYAKSALNDSFTITHNEGVFVDSITATASGGNFLISLVTRPNNIFAPYSFTYQNGDTLVVGANPDYDASGNDNPFLLSDRFVRFAYRFKFDDNEYSLISPFTQSMFIPKQDGYFLGEYGGEIDKDEQEALKSSIISFFENKITKVDLQIDLPEGVTQASELADVMKVKELEVIAKFSDEPSLKVIDSITPFDLADNSLNRIEVTVDSAKSVRVLPENEITRVYDKVPIRAQAQEVVGNRVVFANYIPRQASLDTLDYTVSSGEKNGQAEGRDYFSTIEYPNHTLKQNRTYQVGIVLSDRYGRQSDVILSPNSTVYHPYRDANDTMIDATGVFSGDSLKFILNEPIPNNYYKENYFGIYDEETNPLGWYSYKLVVKQQEQSYYNVYAPTILNGYPVDTTVDKNTDLAHITLLGDNINKIPRDLAEVSQLDTSFRSSEVIYPRVVSSEDVISTEHNAEQFNNLGNGLTVTSIGTRDALGLNTEEDGTTYTDSPFYSIPSVSAKGSDPLIGRISTEFAIGAQGGNDANYGLKFDNQKLNIVETKPTYSNLDIFWETSTSGLISELNDEVNNSFELGQYASGLSPLGFRLNESNASGDLVSDAFYPIDFQGNDIINASTQVRIDSATTKLGLDVKDRFSVVKNPDNSFVIRNEFDTWAYQLPLDKNTIDFTFSVSNTSGGNTFTSLVALRNQKLENSYPTSDLEGVNIGNFNEAPSRDFVVNFPYITRTINFENGANDTSVQGVQTRLEILSFEFFRDDGSTSGWFPYAGNGLIGDGGVPYVNNIAECVNLTNVTGKSATINIGRKVRALNADSPRIWTNTNSNGAYPRVNGSATTNYRIKFRLSDADGSGLSKEFFVRFQILPE